MATYYWVGGTGTWDASSTSNWSASSGGAGSAGVPNSTDTVIFNSLSGTGTCTTASGSACATATLNSSTLAITLGANHSMSGTFTLTLGNLSLGSNTLTCNIFSSNNSNTRSVAFGTGSINVTGNAATIWGFQTVTNFSYTGTPTVNFVYNGSTGTRSINHGSVAGATQSNSLSFNITSGFDQVNILNYVLNLNLTGFSGTLISTSAKNIYGDFILSPTIISTTGTAVTKFVGASTTQKITTNNVTLDFPLEFNGVNSTFVFQDVLTQGSTRATTLTNGTLQFKAGTTNVVGSFATSGTNQKYLQSTVAGSQATLSDASGTNSLSYTTIQDIFATGGATWNAYYANGNIDGGNNTNWNFGGTPSYDAEYGYKLRSFTETGRF